MLQLHPETTAPKQNKGTRTKTTKKKSRNGTTRCNNQYLETLRIDFLLLGYVGLLGDVLGLQLAHVRRAQPQKTVHVLNKKTHHGAKVVSILTYLAHSRE